MNLDEPITDYGEMNYNFTMNAFRSASKPKNIGITPQIVGWNGNSGEIYGDPLNEIEDNYSDQFISISDQTMVSSLSFLLKIYHYGNQEITKIYLLMINFLIPYLYSLIMMKMEIF